jgi:hypothetical protein
MKKVAAVLAAVVMVVSLVSLVFAAEKKVVVKSVDEKTATMVVTDEGKDETLKVDKSVDLGAVKAGEKVDIMIDKDMVTSVKKARSKAAVGC